MKYRVIKDVSLGALEKQVNNLLDMGWCLQGGVTSYYNRVDTDYNSHSGGLTTFRPDNIFIQAMFYSEKKEITLL